MGQLSGGRRGLCPPVDLHDGAMSDFFPEPPARRDEPEVEEHPQPVWLNPPEDMVAGVVPVELVIGRSERAVVMLTGMRAFPSGLSMTLSARTRVRVRGFDLNDEVFDGPHQHDQDEAWQRDRLKWGFEFADGRRATNLDLSYYEYDIDRTPDRPVLSGGGGSGDERSAARDYWLWPLPPAGPLKVVCQWLMYDIQPTTQVIDGEEVAAAAARAMPIWSEPGSPGDKTHRRAVRFLSATEAPR